MKNSNIILNFNEEPIPDGNKSLVDELLNEINKIKKGINKKGFENRLTKFYSFNENRGTWEAQKKIFEKYGKCNSKATDKRKSETEYMGLYFFSEKIGNDFKPVYVGISRKIIQRLRNHAFGKTTDTSTLAYLMKFGKDANKKTKEIYNNAQNDIAEASKKRVRDLFVFIYPYNDCHYKLQLLEVLAACKFKTKWNSFKTH